MLLHAASTWWLHRLACGKGWRASGRRTRPTPSAHIRCRAARRETPGGLWSTGTTARTSMGGTGGWWLAPAPPPLPPRHPEPVTHHHSVASALPFREEKSILSQVKARLGEVFSGVAVDVPTGHQLVIKSCSSVTGEVRGAALLCTMGPHALPAPSPTDGSAAPDLLTTAAALQPLDLTRQQRNIAAAASGHLPACGSICPGRGGARASFQLACAGVSVAVAAAAGLHQHAQGQEAARGVRPQGHGGLGSEPGRRQQEKGERQGQGAALQLRSQAGGRAHRTGKGPAGCWAAAWRTAEAAGAALAGRCGGVYAPAAVSGTCTQRVQALRLCASGYQWAGWSPGWRRCSSWPLGRRRRWAAPCAWRSLRRRARRRTTSSR